MISAGTDLADELAAARKMRSPRAFARCWRQRRPVQARLACPIITSSRPPRRAAQAIRRSEAWSSQQICGSSTVMVVVADDGARRDRGGYDRGRTAAFRLSDHADGMPAGDVLRAVFEA